MTSRSTGQPDLLTSVEVAALLRVHPKHIYRLLARGLPGHRVGSTWRFERSEVLGWSSGRAHEAAPTASAHTSEEPLPLLASNGDIAVELLLAEVQKANVLIGSLPADRTTALAHLAKHDVLAAGFHGDVPPSHLDGGRLARIRLVDREIGLASRGKRLQNLGALRGKRLASRPKTAGVRMHLDQALRALDLNRRSLEVRSVEYASHQDAVLATVRGDADVALTTSAWAARTGLSFTPLASEAYDLMIRAAHMGTPSAVTICEVLQTRAFRSRVGAIAGYVATRTGEIRYEPED